MTSVVKPLTRAEVALYHRAMTSGWRIPAEERASARRQLWRTMVDVRSNDRLRAAATRALAAFERAELPERE